MGQLERQSVKPGQRHVGFNLRESLSLFLLQSFYTHFGNHLHLKGSNCLILALNSPLKFSSASHIIFTPWGRKRVSGWILLMITNAPTHVNRSIIVPFPCSCSQSVMLISNCMYRKLLGSEASEKIRMLKIWLINKIGFSCHFFTQTCTKLLLFSYQMPSLSITRPSINP